MSLLHVPTLGGRIFSVLCGSNLQFMDDAPTIYRSSDWAKHGFFRKCGMHLFYHLLPANEYGLSVGIFQDDPFPLATESQRMEHRGQAPEAGRAWRVHAVQRGDSRPPISVLLLTAAWSIGGTRTGVYFLLCALWRKALLEIVNYMEHYGIVRDPGTPVQPRHSRNTNRRISSWSMFNLTRHSHHLVQGEVPYQDLKPFADEPMMIGCYLTTIVVALIPPLWHRLMTPKVLAWDRIHATEPERRLAADANARSGMTRFVAAT